MRVASTADVAQRAERADFPARDSMGRASAVTAAACAATSCQVRWRRSVRACRHPGRIPGNHTHASEVAAGIKSIPVGWEKKLF